MKDIENLSPEDLHSARHGAGVLCPMVDETVLWYLELHPQADEALVRAKVQRRATLLERHGAEAVGADA